MVKASKLTAADSSRMSWLLLSYTQSLHILHVQVCLAVVVNMCYTIAALSVLHIHVLHIHIHVKPCAWAVS